jgi:hypothetical protein
MTNIVCLKLDGFGFFIFYVWLFYVIMIVVVDVVRLM